MKSRLLALMSCGIMKPLRLLLALVFLYAGASKLYEPPESFADAIAAFQLLPWALVVPFALSLPIFELCVGTLLLLNRTHRLGALGSLCLSIIFLAALAFAFARGLTVDCDCFGSGPHWLPLSPTQRMCWDISRDVGLTFTSLLIYRHALIDFRTKARS